MALSSHLEEDFMCVLCEHVYSEPVNTPCGHNFCRSCIFTQWQGPGPYLCPICEESFSKRPQLQVNVVMKNVVQRLGQSESVSQPSIHSEYGRRDEYGLNGRRDEYGLNGRQDQYGLNGRRDEYGLNGRRDEYGLNGRQDQYGLNGRRDEYGLNGRRDEYGLNGRRDEYGLNGRRDEYGLNGRRDEYGPNGRQDEYSLNGRQDEYGLNRRRDEYGLNGRQDEYGLNGRRDEYGLNGRQDEYGLNRRRDEYGLNGRRDEHGLNWGPSTNSSMYSLETIYSDSGLNKPKVSRRLVWCNFCSEPKSLAVKLCRECSSSFCEVHLQPHRDLLELRTHHLLEPADAPDQVQSASGLDQIQTLEGSEAYTLSGRKLQLRQVKLEEVREVLQKSQQEADLKAAEVVKVFNAVVQEVQASLDQFTQILEDTQTQTQDQATPMIRALEEEIQELKERESSDRLIYPPGHSTPLKPVSLRDWDEVRLAPPSLEQRVTEVVSALEEKVLKHLKNLQLSSNLSHLRSRGVTLTLDPATAHRHLLLSRENTAVSHIKEKLGHSLRRNNNPERFTRCCNVMTRQSFSSGSFYFEVQVSGKTEWGVGVARSSVNKRKKKLLCPANGLWMLWLHDGGQYQALEAPPVPLVLGQAPQKVGVFVDCDLGVVSFHDADTGALLYSFRGCVFRGAILPILNPCSSNKGLNSAPLVLTPVQAPPDTEAQEPTYYNLEPEPPPETTIYNGKLAVSLV